MFTSPKRSIYCNSGDGKLVPLMNAYELECKALSRMSKKETKGYQRAKAILATRVNTTN